VAGHLRGENVMKIVLTWLIALWLVGPICVHASDDNGDVNRFWTSFREAVLEGNVPIVAKKTRFPFEVRGVSDTDPVRHFNRKEFPNVLRQVTSQKIVVQTKSGFEWQTMLDVIKKKKHIDAADLLTPDIFTVELFQFKRLKNHWTFTRAYLEESAE
jgi:hypothetical protein